MPSTQRAKDRGAAAAALASVDRSGIAITTYQEIIRWIGNGDPTTRRLIEKILEQEAEHSNDLQDFLGI